MVTEFNKTKVEESKQVTELWDSYLQQIAAQDYYQQQMLNQTNVSSYSLVGGSEHSAKRKFSFEWTLIKV